MTASLKLGKEHKIPFEVSDYPLYSKQSIGRLKKTIAQKNELTPHFATISYNLILFYDLNVYKKLGQNLA